jgi:RsiW-degrading membrane proteinase PrsW (M82 family)
MINDQQTPNPPYSNLAPTMIIAPPGNKNAIKIVLGVAAALAALLLGLLVLVLIGFETGPIGLLVGLLSATIPVPLYLLLVLWIDRYESEPLWMLATAFFWGALVAVFFAFLLNTASGLTIAAITDSMKAAEAFAAVISAPIVEESAKALILFIFFFWKKDEYDGVIDGIVYAAMVGLGFAMTENIQYYGRAVLENGGGGLTAVFIIRGTLAPFSHPLFTSMTGIGLGLARQSRNTMVKFVTPVVGFLGAICMHGIWNGSAAIFGGPVFLLTYLVIMVPAFFMMLVVIFLALRREGRIVREFLLPDFQGGLITPQEYDQFCTIRGRMGASFNAFSQGGVAHWRACRQFNQLASELAFHRSRVARGIVSRDARACESVYLQALQALQRRLRPGEVRKQSS